MIGRALSPKHLFAHDSFQIFAIIGSSVLVSATLAAFAFVKLARATRSPAGLTKRWSQRPHSEGTSATLSRHPAVAYL